MPFSGCSSASSVVTPAAPRLSLAPPFAIRPLPKHELEPKYARGRVCRNPSHVSKIRKLTQKSKTFSAINKKQAAVGIVSPHMWSVD